MPNRYNEYQNAAAETAVYPGRLGLIQDNKNMTGIYYTSLGFAGETSELMEKILWENWLSDGLIKEMGDVSWYISQCAMELAATLSFIRQSHNDRYTSLETPLEVCGYVVVQAGRYCEIIKKCLRDNHGYISGNIREKLVECLSLALMGIEELCSMHNISVFQVMDTNVQKLRSRKDRNALGGSGDCR